ncbi:MAG: hypothetical protein K2F75_00165, partial [Paramuribaculum sp.]|nr:hypothetical protein [Paramuribaculum sp.]
MKTKTLFSLLCVFLIAGSSYSQNQETTDSLTHELKEVIVTAKQPATQLVGTTLVTTISGSNLAE